jgi:hypothetical protein
MRCDASAMCMLALDLGVFMGMQYSKDTGHCVGWTRKARYVCKEALYDVLLSSLCLQSQIAEDGADVLYVDSNRGHTRSFSSEKIFQEYRAQQHSSSKPPAAAAPPPAVPAAALGTPAAAGAAALAAAGGVGQGQATEMSSFDEELGNDTPSLGEPVKMSDPLGVV